MVQTSDLNRVASIVLRFTRGPILVMIVVYAIGIIGMSLMPGVDAEGNPQRMSLFHSFYFFTYTATTTGFGEIPHNFTEEQRLWTIICLYMGVIAWLYAIGSIIKLIQNPFFVNAIAERQFARSVNRLWSPFYIVCGFGDTGSLLTRGLNDHGLMATVIDGDEERIKALALRDYRDRMPGLCADASVPKHLVDAGIKHPMCRGVVALSADDELNMKIAVMARLLKPEAQVICRLTTAEQQEQIQDIEGITIINPFEIFAEQLRLTITAPQLHTLHEWFIGVRNINLNKPLNIRQGLWVLCGYGRMGTCIQKELSKQNIETVIIDPNVEDVEDAKQTLCANGNINTLSDCGIEDAAGLVAGTSSDAINLGILLGKQQLESDAFVIVRQNKHENEIAFNAANVDLIMQASLVTARNILLRLIAPELKEIMAYLESADPDVTERLVKRLDQGFGKKKPHFMSVVIGEDTPGVKEVLQSNLSPAIGDIIRDPSDRNKEPGCVPFALKRGANTVVLPDLSEKIQINDRLLFCTTVNNESRILNTLSNAQRLSYLITGHEEPAGYFFKWLNSRFAFIDNLEKRFN